MKSATFAEQRKQECDAGTRQDRCSARMHGLGQSARRCCLVTDAEAGRTPIARRRTLAGRPTRESALAGVQYARSRIALLLARGSSGGRAAAPDDDPGIGPSVGRRRRHQTDCAHRAGRWTRSPSSAGRSTSPRSRAATRFGMRRWDRPRGSTLGMAAHQHRSQPAQALATHHSASGRLRAAAR